jgi:uncharacterized protein YprB with RNaseH-like and TPR domain
LRTWYDVLARPGDLPTHLRQLVVDECTRCHRALESLDIGYFVRALAPPDRWRILDHFLDQVSYFDIETAGLEYDDPVTVIACWHRNQLHTFVEHENLDDFLNLLDDVTLLGSFNGSSFDVPRILSTYHIPELPCAHLDLRWLCYHQGHRGGLKEITSRFGISRPADLWDADGALAVRLWARWQHLQDHAAREELLRYCASDVLLLILLAERLVNKVATCPSSLWTHLPQVQSRVTPPSPAPETAPVVADAFGTASPFRLRSWRSRRLTP